MMPRISILLLLFVFTACASLHDKRVKLDRDFTSSDLKHANYIDVRINYGYFRQNLHTVSFFKYYPFPFYGINEVPSFKLCKLEPCAGNPVRTVLIDFYYGRGEDVSTLLSALTLTLFPGKETEDFVVIALVLDDKKQVLKKYEINDRVSIWYQLFLLFGMPFNESGESKRNEVSRNLVFEVLRRAGKDNLL